MFPGVSVSTPAVFGDPDLKRDSADVVMPSDGRTVDFSGWGNDCEPVVFRRHPEIEEMASTLAGSGPVRMTGTGSTLFIPVAEKTQLSRLTMAWKSRYNVRAAGGADRSALKDRLASVRPGGSGV